MLAVQAERLAHLLDLVDEAVELPQRRVVGLVAVVRAELVVVVVLDTRGRQVAVERLEVLVGGARPAVQQQHLDARLLPTRLVQTRNGPFGVSTGIIRTPPELPGDF